MINPKTQLEESTMKKVQEIISKTTGLNSDFSSLLLF
jgi:hypothetical protein